LFTLTVPTGVQVLAVQDAYLNSANSVYISSPDQNDEVVSTAVGRVSLSTNNSTMNRVQTRTNTSSQIRAVAGAASQTLNASTLGWFDFRGKD
jgi:hypothetical protein